MKKIIQNDSFWIILLAALVAIVVQSGNLGSADTARRLQVARWIWANEPPVAPGDEKEFGILGRDGNYHAFTGIGQSLVMLPFDMIGTKFISSSSVLRNIDNTQSGSTSQNGTLRNAFVAYCLAILLNVGIGLTTYKFLMFLEFPPNISRIGTLAFLLGTTVLHYTQNLQENNLLLLLCLSGLALHYKWLLEAQDRYLIAGAIVLGFGLLIRLTAAVDLLAVGIFIGGCLIQQRKSQSIRGRLIKYYAYCGIIFIGYLGLDRAYHFYRFGRITGTYIHLMGDRWRAMYPDLPPDFPFNTPFSVGFFGALFSPEKSLFLFDPLVILTIYLLIKSWKIIETKIKLLLGIGIIWLLAYISLYAKFHVWSGDSAWGDRFITTPVQILALMAIPVFLQWRYHCSSIVERTVIFSIIITSVWIQLTSVFLNYNLEVSQRHFAPTRFVILLRQYNILAWVTGNLQNWGLSTNVFPRFLEPNLTAFGPAQHLGRGIKIVWAGLLIATLITWLISLSKDWKRLSRKVIVEKIG